MEMVSLVLSNIILIIESWDKRGLDFEIREKFIAAGLIEKIEILSDGSSSIYPLLMSLMELINQKTQ